MNSYYRLRNNCTIWLCIVLFTGSVAWFPQHPWSRPPRSVRRRLDTWRDQKFPKVIRKYPWGGKFVHSNWFKNVPLLHLRDGAARPSRVSSYPTRTHPNISNLKYVFIVPAKFKILSSQLWYFRDLHIYDLQPEDLWSWPHGGCRAKGLLLFYQIIFS